jgi:hypothetical protein
MLTVLLTSTAHMLRAINSEYRAADRRSLALQAVQNLAEQIGSTPWDEITPDAMAKLSIPPALEPYLPGASVTASISELQEPVPARRVLLALAWTAPNGQAAAPARLTVWKYRQ